MARPPFHAREKGNSKGSSWWQGLEALDPPAQLALLHIELARLPAHTPLEQEVFDVWLASDKRILPRAGGFLEQPAGLMQAIQLIDLKTKLCQKIISIELKIKEQDLKMQNAGAIGQG